MKQLTALFNTHHHSDHLTGLTDLLFARTVHHEPITPAVGYRIETPDGTVVVSDTRVRSSSPTT